MTSRLFTFYLNWDICGLFVGYLIVNVTLGFINYQRYSTYIVVAMVFMLSPELELRL